MYRIGYDFGLANQICDWQKAYATIFGRDATVSRIVTVIAKKKKPVEVWPHRVKRVTESWPAERLCSP